MKITVEIGCGKETCEGCEFFRRFSCKDYADCGLFHDFIFPDNGKFYRIKDCLNAEGKR